MITSQSGCLVLSSPDIDDPVRTPPFFLSSTAFPDPGELLVISSEQILKEERVEFRADFVSEDAGDDVIGRYYIDYGILNEAGLPYAISQGIPLIDAGSLSDEAPRTARVSVRANLLPEGCHTLTLMLSHAFDNATECPLDMDDAAQITWIYVTCETGTCPVETCRTSEKSAQVDESTCHDFEGGFPLGEGGGEP